MKIFLVSTSFWGLLGQLWFAVSGLFLLKVLLVGDRPTSRIFSRLAAYKRKLLR